MSRADRGAADADLDVRRQATRRHAIVTQADVARAIRATQAAGLTITRVVARADGVAIETAEAPNVEALPLGSLRKRIKF